MCNCCQKWRRQLEAAKECITGLDVAKFVTVVENDVKVDVAIASV